jgi:hypothetical protein
MIRLLRSFAAIVAGYGVMSLTVVGGGILAASLLVPAELRTGVDGPPTPLPAAYVAAKLATSALGGVLGGWLAARIAAFAPFAHAVVLAAIVALTVGWGLTLAGGSPYSIVIGAIDVAGVLAGGKLRAAAAEAAAVRNPW